MESVTAPEVDLHGGLCELVGWRRVERVAA